MGWKRKHKKRRFKGYKHPGRPKTVPAKDQLAVTETTRDQPVGSLPEPSYANVDYGTPTVFTSANFEINSSTIQPDFKIELDRFAEFLLEQSYIRVTIIGHTDDIGSPEANQKLSEARAQSVTKYLVQKGISPYRLSSIGMGDSVPISNGNTEQDRALNRRVEFELEQ